MICTWTGFTRPTAMVEIEERAARERRLAAALRHDAGLFPSLELLERIQRHEAQALKYSQEAARAT